MRATPWRQPRRASVPMLVGVDDISELQRTDLLFVEAALYAAVPFMGMRATGASSFEENAGSTYYRQ